MGGSTTLKEQNDTLKQAAIESINSSVSTSSSRSYNTGHQVTYQYACTSLASAICETLDIIYNSTLGTQLYSAILYMVPDNTTTKNPPNSLPYPDTTKPPTTIPSFFRAANIFHHTIP